MKKLHIFVAIIFVIICSAITFMGGLLVGLRYGDINKIPYVAYGEWSIGIYTGSSPLDISPSENPANPVLTADDVTDMPTRFLADPFMIFENNNWYMFFEVVHARTNQGDIGLATSNNGLDWTYQQVVLNESFHLSFPCVFKWKDEYYMIPESHEAGAVLLYEATAFPTEWSKVNVLIDRNYVDPTFFSYNEKCWLFVSSTGGNTLWLFYADEPIGPWTEHPKSPVVVGNPDIARPAGRVIIYDDRIIRFGMDCSPTYGGAVRAFEVTVLSSTEYEEKAISEEPLLEASGTGWNRDRMHHIDPHMISEGKWIAVVDGHRAGIKIGFKY